MTTYSAEVNIYNPEAIADAVDEAGETASTYITEITGGGIQVHPASNTVDYTQVDADGVHLYKGGESVADFGEVVRIGKDGTSTMSIDSDQITMLDEENNTTFSINKTEVYSKSGYEQAISGTANSSTFVIPSDKTPVASSEITVIVSVIVSGAGTAKTTHVFTAGTAGTSSATGSMTSSVTYDGNRTFRATPRTSSLTVSQITASWYYTETTVGLVESNVVSNSGCTQLGNGTVAGSVSQTALGKYNVKDSQEDYAFIIGNGTSDSARSNAFAVDWDGYIYPMAEKMADWVTEQGTSGIWTYRKWHSGIAECWGNLTSSMAITTSSAGYGGYRSTQFTLNLPSGLFAAVPTTTATMASSQGIWVNNVADTSASSVKFLLSSGVSQSAANRTVCFRCSGRWK